MSEPGRDPFERIYRRHVADVYRFALALLRNPSEAEDVTQTTFLNAYRAFKRGDRPARVNSWLIAIAHNTIRSRRRCWLRRPKEVPFDDAIHGLSLPDEDQATVREVVEVLGTLPETQRTALAMRELEGRSYPEIADTMGVSVPAVESLIARARRTLRAKRQSLRGLTIVQLPRSLRSFLEQGDAAGTSLALKAAAVIVAAGALAGGAAVTGSSAGSSRSTAQPEPSRALVAMAAVELRGSHAAPAKRPPSPSASIASAAAHARHGAAPSVPLSPTRAPAAGGATTPSGRPGAGTSTLETPTATITYRQPEPPAGPTLPTAPTLPSPPSSLDPSTWRAPTPPTLPTPPQAPTPPSVPQVPAPGGIK
jgi:RNA polymerase sigma factor (sigma-70 family)